MNPFLHLRAQVKSALEREAKLNPSERACHQWQFLTTVNTVIYIVGKGGANTMFYSIGIKGERKLCMPVDMLDIITSWASLKFTAYAVCRRRNDYIHGPCLSLNRLLLTDPPVDTFIVGLTPEGKVIRLYTYVKGLRCSSWERFTENKTTQRRRSRLRK
jgi:hypothetical protein